MRVIVPQVGFDGEPHNYRVEDYLVPKEDDIVREEDKTRRAELTSLLESKTYSLEELDELEQEEGW